ncbi:hypothetical protein [Cognatiyoonia sp. IB215182]|uniref:hypothetical protein n=1 Tax=Cognatiyoonia sp. IB215182 TaxID=3097353 RepID=UPI002A10610D|nr:hypothetical protein [Cognatiyoonia sp. IB215182]MDX8354497.1 hypothetical protein [Cognatiyoonia sp. IB215182]
MTQPHITVHTKGRIFKNARRFRWWVAAKLAKRRLKRGPPSIEITQADAKRFPFLESYLSTTKCDLLEDYQQGGVQRVSPVDGRTYSQIFGILMNKYHMNVLAPTDCKDVKIGDCLFELIYFGEVIALCDADGRRMAMLRPFLNQEQLSTVAAEFQVELARYRATQLKAPRRPALLMGNTRPLHYVGEVVGYLYFKHAELKALKEPLQVIETLNQSYFGLEKIFAPYIQSTVMRYTKVNAYCRQNDLMLISGARPSGVSLSNLSAALPWCAPILAKEAASAQQARHATLPPNPMVVVISIDVEKDRFPQQQELASILLTQLVDYAADRGRRLVVAWDGWTIRAQGVTSNDHMMFERIRAITSEFERRWSEEITFTRIYDLPFAEKVAFCMEIEFFSSTHGTAAMVAGGMCGKPGFCYHNPVELATELPLRYKAVHVLSPERAYFLEPIPEHEPQHHWPFGIDLDAVPSIPNLLGKKLDSAGSAD